MQSVKNLVFSVFVLFALFARSQSASYPLMISTTNYGATWSIQPVSDTLPAQFWPNGTTNAPHFAFLNESGLINSNLVIGNLANNTNSTSVQNYQQWLAMVQQIPAGINDSSNRIAAMGVIYTNLLAGTNTQAQNNAQMTQMARQLYFTYVYLNQLITFISLQENTNSISQ